MTDHKSTKKSNKVPKNLSMKDLNLLNPPYTSSRHIHVFNYHHFLIKFSNSLQSDQDPSSIRRKMIFPPLKTISKTRKV